MGERVICLLTLGSDEYIRISASSSLSLEDALVWAEEFIAIQRRVLDKHRQKSQPPVLNAPTLGRDAPIGDDGGLEAGTEEARDG